MQSPSPKSCEMQFAFGQRKRKQLEEMAGGIEACHRNGNSFAARKQLHQQIGRNKDMLRPGLGKALIKWGER